MVLKYVFEVIQWFDNNESEYQLFLCQSANVYMKSC